MSFFSQRFIVLMIFATYLQGFLQLCECTDDSMCGSDERQNLVNQKCSNNLCCSTSNYCGDTENHCVLYCDPKYGRCGPFKVNGTIGFPSIGNRCGLENNNRYCPNALCCSEHGFCGRTYKYCEDGCQHDFGQCDTIANCSVPSQIKTPSQNYNIFPTIPAKQRNLSSENPNFWYLFCKPGSILKKISQPQVVEPVTCNQNDGTWPASKLPECDDNVIYNPMDPSFKEFFDGDLLTCRDVKVKENIEKLIDSKYFAIRDIRITTHKTSLNYFNLSIVDITRMRNNEATIWTKTFNDTIEYGKTVVFLSNVTTPLIGHLTRYIRLIPLSGMRICEIEVSSFYSEQGGINIPWIATVTSLVIFCFLVAMILISVLFFRLRSSKLTTNIDKRHSSNSKNEYALSVRQRVIRPPVSSAVIFPDRNPNLSFGYNDIDIYEEIADPEHLPPLNYNSANDLLGQPEYDDGVSMGCVFKKPKLAPPSAPHFY